MIRPAALALLALTAAFAPSAFAQPSTAGACQPHRGDEVRCAVRLNISASTVTRVVMLDLVGPVGTPIRMQVDTYTSTCGSRGNMIGTIQLEGGHNREAARFVHNPGAPLEAVQLTHGLCVESFVRNCTVSGQQRPCPQLLNLGASKIVVN